MMTRQRDIDSLQTEAAVKVLRAIRRDWGEPGIRQALAAAWRDHDCDYPTLLIAAITAAATPSNLTPGIIPMGGKHWQTTKPEDRTEAGLTGNVRCPKCSWFHRADADCTPPAQAERVDHSDHIAALRAEVRPTVRYDRKEDS